MSPVLKMLIAIGCIVLPLAGLDAQWLSLGPGGGSINALAAAGDTIYAGTDAGVYETIDQGGHWTFCGLDTAGVIALLAKGNILFAASRSGEVYSTPNAGRTWNRADSGLPVSPQTSLMSIGDVLFASRSASYPDRRNNGVFRSGDDGRTWVQVGTQYSDLNYCSSLVRDGDTLYAVTGGLIFRSKDKGNTWGSFYIDSTNKYLSPQHLAISNSIMYAAVQSFGIERSSDYGKTWTLSLYYPHKIISLAAYSGTIIFGTDVNYSGGEGLYRSADNGKTWKNISKFDPINVQAILPADSLWFIGTKNIGVHRSSDSGMNWSGVNDGFANAFVTSLVQHNGAIFANTSIGLFSSTDLGMTWREAQLDFVVNTITSANDDLIAGAPDGIHISHDNGGDWSLLSAAVPLVTAFCADGGRFYACHSLFDIYRSLDSGRTWGAAALNLFYGVNTVTSSDSVVCAAATGYDWDTYTGGVYYSTDYGGNWSISNTGNVTPPVAIKITNFGVYAGIDMRLQYPTRSGVVRSLDNGRTWTEVNSSILGLFVTSFLQVENTIYVGTSNHGLLRIEDEGTKILPVFPTMQYGVSNVSCMASLSGYLFVGTPGYGIWRVPLAVTSVDENRGGQDHQLRTFMLFQNYPNPFNPTTTISFTVPSPSHVTLKIFNALGQDVATIVSEELAAGSYQRQWQASGRPSGVYFYRLQAGSFTETKRLLLLR
jgi:photosystem II stability/assembly factor-like uncharacterized protein